MFATPCSENVRSSVFGAEHRHRVIELHRLHILDVTPRNTESWFISRCLKMLSVDKPEIRAVISFSDLSEGHSGIIYRATNAIYCGQTGSKTFYIDANGRLRHPRQNGVNISREDALSRGWSPVKRSAKNRYIYLIGNRKERKIFSKLCKYSNINQSA